MDINETLKERGSRYGEFKSHAVITQALKRVMRGETMTCNTNWNTLSNDKQEALEMIAHKIGRILNGCPEYIDNWVDLSGYSTLIINELSQDNKDGR